MKKKKEITIVTAFFDIGRKDFQNFSRTNEKYLNDFKYWARIQNNVVVYTDEATAKKVLKIREEFGLKDKTKVVIINDYRKIEPDILSRMQEIEKSEYFLNYRYSQGNPENTAVYNYVMLLKSWCLKDAAEKKYADGLIAWLDFGFNHGGKVFYDEKDFDFYWDYQFADDKITYFQLNDEPIKKPVFYLVQSFEVLVMGAVFIVPAKLAERHYELIKNANESLNDMGFMDDDQLLMLMAKRKDPSIFEYEKSDWFLPIKEYGNKKMKTREVVKKKISPIDKVLNKLRVFKRNYLYYKRIKDMLFKKNLD